MTFSELAKTLNPFYSGEMTVHEFTKELLLQITDNIDAVLKYKRKKELTERDGKTFDSYYYGRKPITPIAKKITDTHIKRDKFLSFLKRKEFDTDIKEELCKAFVKYIPNKTLNNDNIFEAITEEYVRIIRSCILNSDTKLSTSTIDIEEVSVREATEGVEIDEVESFMLALKEVVRNLQKTGHKIASRKIKPIISKLDVPLEIYEALTKSNVPTNITSEFDKEYDELQGVYDLIYKYNVDHNNETLSKVLKLILNINKEDFIETWNSPTIMTLKNQSVFNLNKFIQDYFQNKDE